MAIALGFIAFLLLAPLIAFLAFRQGVLTGKRLTTAGLKYTILHDPEFDAVRRRIVQDALNSFVRYDETQKENQKAQVQDSG